MAFVHQNQSVMRISNTGTLVLLLLTAACQSGPSPQQSGKVVDSLIPDTVAAIGTPGPPADPVETQIRAQDTLFEDGSIPASWETAGFNDPEAFKRFLVQFKEWVRTDNVDSISAHIEYPIKGYRTPEQFKKSYANIFDKQMKDVIEKQRLDRIFRNYQGAMLADGAIWFYEVDKKGYRIIAINAKR